MDKAIEAAAEAMARHEIDDYGQRDVEIYIPLATVAISAYQAASGEGWRPISEAPKDGTLVLCAFSGGETSWHFDRCVCRWSGSELSLWSSKGVSGLQPDAWMPILAIAARESE